MSLKRVLLTVSVLALGSRSVHALSCAPAKLSEDDLKSADVVFIGEVESVTRGQRLGADNTSEVAVLRVIQAWKGTRKDERVKILRNSYWGDGSQVGKQILVVSKAEKGEYWTPSCKRTQHYPNNEESLKVIQKHFGL